MVPSHHTLRAPPPNTSQLMTSMYVMETATAIPSGHCSSSNGGSLEHSRNGHGGNNEPPTPKCGVQHGTVPLSPPSRLPQTVLPPSHLRPVSTARDCRDCPRQLTQCRHPLATRIDPRLLCRLPFTQRNHNARRSKSKLALDTFRRLKRNRRASVERCLCSAVASCWMDG